MRFILFTLLFCSGFSTLSAQTLPIVVDQRWYGPAFLYDNLYVTGFNFRRALYQDPEALSVLSGSGGIEFLGATASAVGGIFILEGLVADYPFEEGTVFNDATPAILTGIGAVGVGVLLQGIANRKRKRAVDVYNGNLLRAEPMGSLRKKPHLAPASSGLGFALKF